MQQPAVRSTTCLCAGYAMRGPETVHHATRSLALAQRAVLPTFALCSGIAPVMQSCLDFCHAMHPCHALRGPHTAFSESRRPAKERRATETQQTLRARSLKRRKAALATTDHGAHFGVRGTTPPATATLSPMSLSLRTSWSSLRTERWRPWSESWRGLTTRWWAEIKPNEARSWYRQYRGCVFLELISPCSCLRLC